MLDINLLFKIGAFGIAIIILDRVLKSAGKEDIAMVTNLAGIIIILMMVISLIGKLFTAVKTMFNLWGMQMEIIKISAFAFVALFIVMLFKERQKEIALQVSIVVGILIFLFMLGKITTILQLLQQLALKADIDFTYLNIVFKVLGIAYIASFCSEICRDAGEVNIANKVEFCAKILIIVLAIPILMAVLQSILKII